MRAMRGQMFIITMVFLAGLVVFVSQLLMSYSSVDVSDIPDRTATFVASEYVDMINETIRYSRNCTDANRSVMEMNAFLQRLVTENYHSNVLYDRELVPCVDCEKYNDLSGEEKLFKVDMEVVTGTSEVMGEYDIYREFIVFSADPICRIDDGSYDVWAREWWCKSEDPEEPGACRNEWFNQVQDCKHCTDTDQSNNHFDGGVTTLVLPCSSGDSQCPGEQIYPDRCTVAEAVEDSLCVSDTQIAYMTPYDCNQHDEDNCWTGCNLATGNMEYLCDDWTCISDLADGSYCAIGPEPNMIWSKGMHEDCKQTCEETDNTLNQPYYYGRGTTTVYPELCTDITTSCPVGGPYDENCACPVDPSVTDYCILGEIPQDRLVEHYCNADGTSSEATVNCDDGVIDANSDKIVARGDGCNNGRCFDCDDDGDSYCEHPYDGSGARGSYDCCDTCSHAYPGTSAYWEKAIDEWPIGYFDCRDSGEGCGSSDSNGIMWNEWDYDCNGAVDAEYENRHPNPEGSSCSITCTDGWLEILKTPSSCSSTLTCDCGTEKTWVDMTCTNSICKQVSRAPRVVKCH